MSANSDYLMIYREDSVQRIIILFLSKKKGKGTMDCGSTVWKGEYMEV